MRLWRQTALGRRRLDCEPVWQLLLMLPAMVGDALMVGSRRGGVARKFLALWKHGTPHASLVALAQVAGHCSGCAGLCRTPLCT